eukprot:10679666-Alexandrium_andersonii.AAC.1
MIEDLTEDRIVQILNGAPWAILPLHAHLATEPMPGCSVLVRALQELVGEPERWRATRKDAMG